MLINNSEFYEEKTGQLNNLKVRDITIQDAAEVANLHIEGINTGFISSLGIDFVTALYEAIAQDTSSFGFVVEENDRTLGFVAFTEDLDKLYRAVIVKKGIRFILLLARGVFSLRRLKKILETLFYPARIKKANLPRAELLSIVIAEEQQGRGLATILMQKGLTECSRRKIEKVKVLVGADNERANKLYLKCGFELVRQIDNHGVLSNIYVRRTNLV